MPSDGADESVVETDYTTLAIAMPEDQGGNLWTTAPWLVAGGDAEDGFADAALLRIDFDAAAATPIARPTDVWTLETRRFYGPRVDDEGRAYHVYRDAYGSGLWVTEDDGLGWEPFGATYEAASFIEVHGRSGTFVVHASDASTFVPIAPWEEPPAGSGMLDPGVVELLSERHAVARTFEPGTTTLWLRVSADGRSVGFSERPFREERWTVTAHDLATGAVEPLWSSGADSVNLLAWL